MLGEQLLARVGLEMGKALAGVGQHQVAFAELGEPQQLQRFAEMEDLVGFELQMAGQHRQVGMAVIGRRRQRLDQAGQHVGGDVAAAPCRRRCPGMPSTAGAFGSARWVMRA